jgi:alpha-tubulin suppressor-like RCC1 family protein
MENMMRIINVILLSTLLLSFAIGCDDKTQSVNNCGNDLIDTGEDCDGIRFNTTCDLLGYYGGDLICNADCTFDLQPCILEGICGDENINVNDGEECDPAPDATVMCSSEGLGSGIIGCVNCKLDYSDCEGECGDGTVQSVLGEECEGIGSILCSNLDATKYYDTGDNAVCNENSCLYDISACEYCGDGDLNGTEQCDSTTTATCSASGYFSGTPSCATDCQSVDYDTCTRFVKISTGSEHACALDNKGQIWCWGSNALGKAGIDASDLSVFVPAPIYHPDQLEFTHISCGGNSSCAIDENKNILCWGRYIGTTNSYSPTYIPLNDGFKDITSGAKHNCALTDDGTAYCWGVNYYGQLGNGVDSLDSTYYEPVLVSDSSNLESISAGADHTCAVDKYNNAWCWGRNNFGQLGIGNQTMRLVMTKIDGFDFESISAGKESTCAITTDSSVYCWGDNREHEIGNGIVADLYNSPEMVSTNLTFHKVSVDASHVCAVSTLNTAHCWGRGTEGQTGDNDTSIHETPLPVTFTNTVLSISTGVNFSCLLDNYTAYCFGSSTNYKRGNSSEQNAVLPANVTGYY